jgi:two-component system chemotaxis response regulator CheY
MVGYGRIKCKSTFSNPFFWQIGLKKCNNCYFNDVKMELRELKTVVEKKSTIKRILLVDDSPIIHKLLRRTLEAHGYEVCGDAKNGREAVSMYQSLKPDLVFMDITMPVMDGLEASGEILKMDPQARIIMLSAMGDEQIVNRAKELGIDNFLKKPFNDYKIISAISGIV